MPSNPVSPITYNGIEFDHRQRPMAAAALLSADPFIQPTSPETWSQRDLNELQQRGWISPAGMRVDRLWRYRVTEVGQCVAESLREEGLTWDGFDLWDGEELIR